MPLYIDARRASPHNMDDITWTDTSQDRILCPLIWIFSFFFLAYLHQKHHYMHDIWLVAGRCRQIDKIDYSTIAKDTVNYYEIIGLGEGTAAWWPLLGFSFIGWCVWQDKSKIQRLVKLFQRQNKASPHSLSLSQRQSRVKTSALLACFS